MACDCQCSVTLPNGAVGQYVVCDCVFPDHIHLSFQKLLSLRLFNFVTTALFQDMNESKI